MSKKHSTTHKTPGDFQDLADYTEWVAARGMEILDGPGTPAHKATAMIALMRRSVDDMKAARGPEARIVMTPEQRDRAAGLLRLMADQDGTDVADLLDALTIA